MFSYKNVIVSTSITLLTGSAAFASPIGVDGTIGAEWAGVTPVHVNYDANAPINNFAAGPYAGTNGTGYNIYVRDDGSYYYMAFQTDSTPPMDFANVYLGNNVDGAFLGFELNNSRAFVPGVSGYYNYDATSGIAFADSIPTGGNTIEVAVPNTVFTQDTLGIPDLTSEIYDGNGVLELRDSQSFGYTYSGDPTLAARYGEAAVPEPTTLGLLGMTSLGLLRRRRAVRGS